jgi:hypothetical protein
MQRLLCWATAVEANVTAVIAATLSETGSASSKEQSTTVIETTAQPRAMERACLAFIESSARQRHNDPEYRDFRAIIAGKRISDRAPVQRVIRITPRSQDGRAETSEILFGLPLVSRFKDEDSNG